MAGRASARHDRWVTIRRALAGDAAALARLCRAWHDEGRDQPTADPDYERRFTNWYAVSGHLIWLAEADGAAVGFADLEIRARRPEPGGPARRWGYLEGMYVLDPHRGHGIGAALLAAVLDAAERDGLSDVVLHPTRGAVSLYRRAGFEFVSTEQQDPMRLAVTRLASAG